MKVPHHKQLGFNELKEMDPEERPITLQELKENCGFRTVAEAAADLYQEPTGITWPEYTWRQRIENLERLYDKLRTNKRSEREIQESIEFYLETMRNRGLRYEQEAQL